MRDKGKRARWERRISRERTEDDNYVVRIYHSNRMDKIMWEKKTKK